MPGKTATFCLQFIANPPTTVNTPSRLLNSNTSWIKQWNYHRSPIEQQTRHRAGLLIWLFHAITFGSFSSLSYEWYMTWRRRKNNLLRSKFHFSFYDARLKWKMCSSLIINPRSVRCFTNNSWKRFSFSFNWIILHRWSKVINRHEIINFNLCFSSEWTSIEEVHW